MGDVSVIPLFLTVQEIADTLRVSKMSVYRLIRSGELPVVKVGKQMRVPQRAFTAWCLDGGSPER